MNERENPRGVASCNVSSRLNFTIGAVAIVAAIVIGYWAWHWLR